MRQANLVETVRSIGLHKKSTIILKDLGHYYHHVAKIMTLNS
jgi:hypothetical protein